MVQTNRDCGLEYYDGIKPKEDNPDPFNKFEDEPISELE